MSKNDRQEAIKNSVFEVLNNTSKKIRKEEYREVKKLLKYYVKNGGFKNGL